MRQDTFGPHQLAGHLGARHWHVDRACELGLLPDPDVGGRRWSAAAAEEVQSRWPQVLAAIEAARELGAARCAGLLGQRTGLQAEAADVEELADRGLITVSG